LAAAVAAVDAAVIMVEAQGQQTTSKWKHWQVAEVEAKLELEARANSKLASPRGTCKYKLTGEDFPSLSPAPSPAKAAPNFTAAPLVQQVDPLPEPCLEALTPAAACAPLRRDHRRSAPAGVVLTPGGKNAARSKGAAKEEPARKWKAKAPVPESVTETPEEPEVLPPRRLSVHFDMEDLPSAAQDDAVCKSLQPKEELCSAAQEKDGSISMFNPKVAGSTSPAAKQLSQQLAHMLAEADALEMDEVAEQEAAGEPTPPIEVAAAEEPALTATPTAEDRLREALAEIERLKRERGDAIEAEIERVQQQKEAEIQNLKRELKAAKRCSTGSSGSKPRRHSMSGASETLEGDCELAEADVEEEQDVFPEPPDSSCWEWPLSRHEKKVRIQLLERQMHAMDRKSWRVSLEGARQESSSYCDSDSEGE